MSEKTVTELIQLLDRQSRDIQLLCEQNVRLMADLENWKDYYWPGGKPGLLLSGPGIGKQPIPPAMLCR